MFIISFQFISYLILLLISAFITLGLAFCAFRYKNVKGAKSFAISMLIGSLWALANCLEMAGSNLLTKIFWANIQYFFYTSAPVVWLIMVFEFTGKEDRVNKRNIYLFSIIPVITIILVWTNNYHHLIRYNVYLNSNGPFPVVAKEYGYWFWVHLIYCYLLNSYNIILLIGAIWRRNSIYRKQVICLSTGFVIIFVSNLLYVIGLSPIKLYDITPVLFSISAVIMGWGIFYFQLFDLVPVARTRVIEDVATGIIVIDNKNRVIDINPHARKIFSLTKKGDFVGQRLSNIADNLQKLSEFISEEDYSKNLQKEFTLLDKENKYYYELFSSPINDYRKEQVARVLIINDITALKQARDQINKQQQELAVMNERERMARDLHDNLGQILSFSGIQVQAVRQQFKKQNFEKADQYLLELKKIVRDAHRNIREYVYNVRDSNYFKEDFLSLLNKLIEEFRENSEILFKLELNIPGKENEEFLNFLGTEEKLHLINIAREVLTNVLKYADATEVNICLNLNSGKFEFIIEDNGRGIKKLDTKGGSGINIMYERARLIGGEFNIKSEYKYGTRVTVNLPVEKGGKS